MVQGKVEICGVNTAKSAFVKGRQTRKLYLRRSVKEIPLPERPILRGNLRLVLSVIKRFYRQC